MLFSRDRANFRQETLGSIPHPASQVGSGLPLPEDLHEQRGSRSKVLGRRDRSPVVRPEKNRSTQEFEEWLHSSSFPTVMRQNYRLPRQMTEFKSLWFYEGN